MEKKLKYAEEARNIQPTRAMLLFSVPCEHRAAAIRKKTLKALAKGDRREVALAYEKNFDEEFFAGLKLFTSLFFSPFMMHSVLYGDRRSMRSQTDAIDPHKFILIFILCFLIPYGITNAAALRRYDLSRRQARDWLKENVTEDDCAEYDNAKSHRLV